MKSLTPELQAHLASGATTLCHCWQLKRHDGTALGFTDHDEDLAFGGTLYEAAAGFTASSLNTSATLAVDNLDVLGALASSHLSDADLTAGLFDNAEIEIWRVNWQDPDQRVLLRKGNLGEVHRGAQSFTAEVRGLSHRLNQPTGRLFQYACDADLGDARCGIALANSTFTGGGTIATVTENREVTVSGLDGFEDGWFARGLCTFTSGVNTGEVLEVKAHTRRAGTATLMFWHAPAQELLEGVTFSVVAGCDKQFATCQAKFSNTPNFRGFPHMPGNDFALFNPLRGDGNDGGSQN